MKIPGHFLLFSVLLVACCASPAPIHGQEKKSSAPPDSTIVFGTIEPTMNPALKPGAYNRAFGLSVMISTNGFGLGMFYRREFSDVLSGAIDLTVSESRDEDEKEYTDIYGRPVTIGKVNRFLILPLFLSIERRLFKDDILDNFRPYITAAAGPSMIYVFPYNEEYFSALAKGSPKYTFGGFIGGGAYIGSDRSSLLGINIRYYYIPYYAGIENLTGVYKSDFGGIYISLSFGSAW